MSDKSSKCPLLAGDECVPLAECRAELKRLHSFLPLDVAAECAGDLAQETFDLQEEIRRLRGEIDLVHNNWDDDREELTQGYEEDLRKLRAEVKRLKAVLSETIATCICGCPMDDHENYDEDGSSCENEHHECVLTSHAAADIAKQLRDKLSTHEEAMGKARDQLIVFLNSKRISTGPDHPLRVAERVLRARLKGG